jgi:hypothetical protein
MGAMLIKAVILGAVGTGAIGSVLHDRDFITLVNTFLNAASWYLLIKARHKLRTEVSPALAHVEETVAAVAEQVSLSSAPSAVEGGRRTYDPPCPPCEDK